VSDITVEDMRDWLKRPETKLFFSYVDELKTYWDEQVHIELRRLQGDEKEAYKANVAMDTIVDVVELIEDQIMPTLKEKEKDET